VTAVKLVPPGDAAVTLERGERPSASAARLGITGLFHCSAEPVDSDLVRERRRLLHVVTDVFGAFDHLAMAAAVAVSERREGAFRSRNVDHAVRGRGISDKPRDEISRG